MLAESALRFRLCPADSMAAQLERLAVASTMRTIRLGIIPFEASYPVAPIHGFHVFDDQRVAVETLAAELTITQASEVATYLGAFARLADMAVYGRDARVLIERAVDDLVSGL